MRNFFKLKAKRSIAGVIALVAVIGFGFTACGDDNGNGGNDVVIPIEYRGTWVGTGNIEGELLTITATTVKGTGPTHTINRVFPAYLNVGHFLQVVEYREHYSTIISSMHIRVLDNGELFVSIHSLEGISNGNYTKQD
jgi:hypothetical protein